MKKKSSVIISDDSVRFRGVAREDLGDARQFATCSWHLMNNAKKQEKGWDEKKLFWPYQGARTQFERAERWECLRRRLPRAALVHLQPTIQIIFERFRVENWAHAIGTQCISWIENDRRGIKSRDNRRAPWQTNDDQIRTFSAYHGLIFGSNSYLKQRRTKL